MSDFENEIPKHMGATHAISKSERNFRNHFPKELDQKLDIAGHKLDIAGQKLDIAGA